MSRKVDHQVEYTASGKGEGTAGGRVGAAERQARAVTSRRVVALRLREKAAATGESKACGGRQCMKRRGDRESKGAEDAEVWLQDYGLFLLESGLSREKGVAQAFPLLVRGKAKVKVAMQATLCRLLQVDGGFLGALIAENLKACVPIRWTSSPGSKVATVVAIITLSSRSRYPDSVYVDALCLFAAMMALSQGQELLY
ncbi:hypothetical protein GOP47_0001432 [Adiantum capillus-veneris]|uniref:Uncharacterized protein n=1 Tax=Adiantum capillus-veneris TaxID=13818 RepID=A0A9D4V8C5_ADICA|nr:hypothetical protein GOP47_0001432 [Adiantum capillus-veneris]